MLGGQLLSRSAVEVVPTEACAVAVVRDDLDFG